MRLKTKNLMYEGKLTCKLCGKTFKHLGSHLWHKHKVLAHEYKEQFGLPFREALIDIDIYKKKKAHFDKHRKKYLKKLVRDNGYRFKKRRTGQRRISQKERDTVVARIKRVNERKLSKLKPCVVCHMKYDHVESHLYTKHGLIKVK